MSMVVIHILLWVSGFFAGNYHRNVLNRDCGTLHEGELVVFSVGRVTTAFVCVCVCATLGTLELGHK